MVERLRDFKMEPRPMEPSDVCVVNEKVVAANLGSVIDRVMEEASSTSLSAAARRWRRSAP